MTAEKIDCKNLFAILFLSRIFISFTKLGIRWDTAETGDILTAQLMFAALAFITAVPSLYYIKTSNGVGILKRYAAISPVLSKAIAIFYIFAFFLVCAVSAIRYELFTSSIVLPDTEPPFFMALILAASCYGAYKGIAANSRASLIISAVVGSAVVFIALTLTKKIDTYNITPLFYNGFTSPARLCLYSLAVSAEIPAITVFLSEVKGKIMKNYLIWIAVLMAAITTLVFITTGVLGNFGKTRMFPIYTACVQADLGIFQRIDIILTGIWTLCVIVKLAFFIYTLKYCIEQGFGKKGAKAVPLAVAVLLFIVSVLPHFDLSMTMSIFNTALFLVIFIISAVILPLAAPILEKVKNGKSRKYKKSEAKHGVSI